MKTNPEYEFLSKAVKGTAPFVGVAVPGHAPLVLDRKRLSGALRGVTPMNVEVVWAEDGRGRSLLVEGMDGRVRTRLRMVCRSWKDYAVQLEMDRWTREQQRKQVRTAFAPANLDRRAAAEFNRQAALLHKLERELVKLGATYTLYNPAVPRLREVDESTYNYYGPVWQAIRDGKRLRTIIGGIAAQARRENWTNLRLYKELEAHEIKFEKLSSMTAKEREQRVAETFFDYLKNLYRFCECCGNHYGKSYWQMVRGKYAAQDHQQWGPERYMAKLADLQMRRSLQSQIDSVKAMMARTPFVQEEIAA